MERITLPKDWLDHKLRDSSNTYNMVKEQASSMVCPFPMPNGASASDYTAWMIKIQDWAKKHNVHWEGRPYMPGSTNNPKNEVLMVDGVEVGWLQAVFTESGEFKVTFAPCRNELIEQEAPNL